MNGLTVKNFIRCAFRGAPIGAVVGLAVAAVAEHDIAMSLLWATAAGALTSYLSTLAWDNNCWIVDNVCIGALLIGPVIGVVAAIVAVVVTGMSGDDACASIIVCGACGGLLLW